MIAVPNNNKGFTLIELLIAMAISGIVMAAIYSAYDSQQKAHVTQQQVVDMQQNIRAAMYYMETSIRMAGCDPLGSANAGFVSNFDPPYNTFGVTTGANKIAFTIDDNNSGFIENNHDELVAYRLNNNILEKFIIDPGSGAVSWPAVADNIDVLDFVYLDGNNPPNVLATPLANPADVRSVQVTIIARTGRGDPKYADTNVYRNQQGTVLLPAPLDNVRRRLLTTNIKCRNLGL